MRDLISKRTRTEFREHLVGFTLREIDIEFENEDFSADLTYEPPGLTGQRRTLVEQYYRTINFRDRAAVTRLLSVFQTIVEKTKAYSPDHAAALAGHLRRDGVDVDAPSYRLPDDRNPHLEPLLGVADRLTASELAGQIERMRAAIDADPALAIGTAKELVETTCKTILRDAGKPPASTLDLGDLVKAAMAELKLVPDDIDDRAKGADAIKKSLRSLTATVAGLGEIRNVYGSGHGRHGRARGLTPRHARLAVGAAATLATFLFETHADRLGSDT